MKFVNSIPFGRFGPRGFCRDEAPTTHYMRGALPLGSKSLDLASAPPIWGCSAPPPRGILQGRKSLLLQCRRSALHPGDFPVAGKVTKGAPEPTVLDSLSAGLPPFSRSLRCAPARAGLVSATEKDRFATLSL